MDYEKRNILMEPMQSDLAQFVLESSLKVIKCFLKVCDLLISKLIYYNVEIVKIRKQIDGLDWRIK